MILPNTEHSKSANAILKWTHFLDAINRLRGIPEYKHYKLEKLCEMANNSGAPRYYVCAKPVLAIYCTWKKTNTLPITSDSLKKMYLEIFEKYENIIQYKKVHGYSVEYMEYVLSQPASSFFIDNAVKFYYRAYTYKRKLNKLKECRHS